MIHCLRSSGKVPRMPSLFLRAALLALPAGDCLPFPNLVVLSARQTR